MCVYNTSLVGRILLSRRTEINRRGDQPKRATRRLCARARGRVYTYAVKFILYGKRRNRRRASIRVCVCARARRPVRSTRLRPCRPRWRLGRGGKYTRARLSRRWSRALRRLHPAAGPTSRRWAGPATLSRGATVPLHLAEGSLLLLLLLQRGGGCFVARLQDGRVR